MTDERIIAYLLKELPEEELERFEDDCFAQEDWPEHLKLVEEDLIDDYLRGELTPEQRRRFESDYLTTDARQERVSVAAALLRHVDESNAAAQAPAAATPAVETWAERFRAFRDRPSWLPRVAMTFALLAIVSSVWWLTRTPSPPTITALALSPSISTRNEGAQASTVTLPPGADALRISLTLPDAATAAASHRVTLEDERGETRALEVSGQEARSVSVLIPASQLARGQYALKLFAVKEDGTEQRVGSYLFNVR
jgi:anti-sigma factor RsiW